MTLELLRNVPRLPLQGAGLRAALAMASRIAARLDGMHVVDMPAAAFTVPEAVLAIHKPGYRGGEQSLALGG